MQSYKGVTDFTHIHVYKCMLKFCEKLLLMLGYIVPVDNQFELRVKFLSTNDKVICPNT